MCQKHHLYNETDWLCHEVECKSPMNLCVEIQDFEYILHFPWVPQLPRNFGGVAPTLLGEKVWRQGLPYV